MKYTEYQDLLPSEILENVQNIHAELSTMGFTEEIKEAKSGPVLSYMKDRKVLLNYVYRKSGIKVRLYAFGILTWKDIMNWSYYPEKSVNRRLISRRNHKYH